MKNFENILTMILVFLPQTLNTEFFNEPDENVCLI